MSYSKDELAAIVARRPDLKKLVVPSLDSVIVEFLEKYEVYVKPATTAKRNKAADMAMGAVMGAIDPLAVGVDSGLRGQSKNAAIQEWTQWKQWALNHQDFETFKQEKARPIDQKNKSIQKTLESPEIKQLLEDIKQKQKEEEERDEKEMEVTNKIFFWGIGFMGIILIALMSAIHYHYQPRQVELKEESTPQQSPQECFDGTGLYPCSD